MNLFRLSTEIFGINYDTETFIYSGLTTEKTLLEGVQPPRRLQASPSCPPRRQKRHPGSANSASENCSTQELGLRKLTRVTIFGEGKAPPPCSSRS